MVFQKVVFLNRFSLHSYGIVDSTSNHPRSLADDTCLINQDNKFESLQSKMIVEVDAVQQ